MQLKVFDQSALMLIRTSTQKAHVFLQVFRLQVSRNVRPKGLFVLETLVATITLVWLVHLVRARVRLQVGQLTKLFGAIGMGTFVGFVAGVGSLVLLEVRELGELSRAGVATVWFNSVVNARVLRQIGGICKRLGALGTLVGFCLSIVTLIVRFHFSLGYEDLS